MAFGLQSTGFRIKRLETIKTEIENELRVRLGNGINLLPESVFGQLIGVFAERESLLWEQLDAIYDAQYPDTATDAQLDLAVSLVGLTRLQATRTLVEGQLLFGTVGTVIPAGTQFSVEGSPNSIFETLTEVTLVAGADEEQEVTWSATPDDGSFTFNFEGQETASINWDDDAAAVQAALEALGNIGAGNVAVTGDFATGFTINFQNLLQKQPLPELTVTNNTLEASSVAVTATVVTNTEGVIQGSTNMQAINFGPVAAPQFGLTEIETPVFGLDGTVNPSSGVTGRNLETDAELRARREIEIQTAGEATPGAILAAVLNVADVEAAIVFFNNTAVVDVEGRPPNSVEVVVQGGDDGEIAQVLFETIAAGIGTFGSVSETAIDSQGFSHPIDFSRPTEVELLLEVDLTVDAVAFPSDGDDLAAANFKTYVDSLSIGEDVVTIPRLMCALTGLPALGIDEIPGILDVEIRISKKPTAPTTDDTIVIDRRELAAIDLGDITINIL